MKLRYANENDCALIKENDKFLAERLILKKLNNNEIILAEQGGIIIGWLRFGYFWDNIPFINMLWINEGYRGKGIGKKITLFWESEMKSRNFKIVMTSTLSSENAQHFYRRLGYKDVGGLMLENEPLELLLIKHLG